MSKTIERSHATRELLKAKRPLCALVTGASSGIGYAFAKLLAEKGHNLVLVARRESVLRSFAAELEAAHPITVTVMAQDLSDGAAPAALVAQTEELGLEIDVLVNVAGATMDGHFLSYEWEEHRAYQQLMALTPAELTHRFLPGMLRRGFGQVINMGSIAGLMPSTPFNSLYGPCKTHMLVLTRSLQIEYGEAGISFSCCCPGPVADTSIIETRHGQAWSRYTMLVSPVREVVEKAYEAAERGKVVQSVGALTIATTLQSRLLPTQVQSVVGGAGVMFLGHEKKITSAADAGV